MPKVCRWHVTLLVPVTICFFVSLCRGGYDVRAFILNPLHSRNDDAAMKYYVAALRGAAEIDTPSSTFRRLAKLHYTARKLRNEQNWDGAVELYHKAIAMQKTAKLDEAPKMALAACSWLNLALTEKECSIGRSRKSFQRGTQMVQQIMERELHMVMRTDAKGRPRIKWQARGRAEPRVRDRKVHQVACKWLATLLVSWGLLEVQQGKSHAKRLLERAAFLDGHKKKVLSWKVVQETTSEFLNS
eukprot:TRINITY_DN18627_c0_g1_i2.p1 TRINITY_DN18627_c0_g1~~TRINITY_DN18627_c0_g1_i2.p1  ORF type:complete len:260 (+),score=41.60 TRINITY_DN18627_c0_g1_i2:50-781(+)